MTQTTISRIGEHVGQVVTIKGWLHNRRSSGKIHFLVVRDGTGFLQVVMGKKDVDEATFQTADHLSQEIGRIIHEGIHHVRLHLGAVQYISSAGIRVLLQFHKHV